MNILLSPHDDDNALFASFTCMRERPLVVICLDSWIQPNRGERGCSAEERAAETAAACNLLGCPVVRLGLRDDAATEADIKQALTVCFKEQPPDVVYAPAEQGGNRHHDMVARAAHELFGDRVIEYTTYTPTELWTRGVVEVHPTAAEAALKRRALECYPSQIRINAPHFAAVWGKTEWLNPPTVKLYLGAGNHRLPGFIHVDRLANADVVCDITQGLPMFATESVDHVYTQDFMEHLPQTAAVPVINEIWRVLKVGGCMEHVIPNAGSQNAFGSPTHLSHWSLRVFEHFDKESYRWKVDRHYEGFIGAFNKVKADLISFVEEPDGCTRAQAIHVKYIKVEV